MSTTPEHRIAQLESELAAQRAELRMVVKAGSILEDEKQRGIAHFLEHMAFNGSVHFPGNCSGEYRRWGPCGRVRISPPPVISVVA